MAVIDEKKYRHELKYTVSAGQIILVKNRIKSLLTLDSHAGEGGSYSIRSMYFDDYYDRCYYENENGTDPREKFRIRIYNGSSDRITLECKRKERGKTQKLSCPLTLEQAELLMRGKTVPDIGGQHPLLQRLCCEMLTRRMHPVVIVDYDRIPYVYKNGNVRVTLDTNISASRAVDRFFDKDIPRRPVMPMGQSLLEVKYDEYLPDHIYRSLQLQELRQTAFSKYYICRKFTRQFTV